MSITEFVYCRKNIIRLDIYYEKLMVHFAEQNAAYDNVAFFGKCALVLKIIFRQLVVGMFNG